MAGLFYGLLVCGTCLELVVGGSSLVPLTEYVFVSQPGLGSVAVTEVNALTRQVVRESRPLITSGLHEPCGLAMDHKRQRLYVADPKSRKVFMYKLYFDHNGVKVHEDQQFVAASNLTPRWVTVDEKGTLFATDEARSFIAEVGSEELSLLEDSAEMPQFHRLYTGDKDAQVDKPGGIAVDGSNIYWGNRAHGAPYGSLLMAPEDPAAGISKGVPQMIQSLSKNVDKVYGVCATPSLVFYTGGSRQVYGSKPGAYNVRSMETVLLNNYATPRGCVFDGDGTVFLADKGGEAVWSFPSSAHSLGMVQATKLFEVKDPYGVAVFRPSLAIDAVGFLRGGTLQTGPAFIAVLVTMLGVFGYNA